MLHTWLHAGAAAGEAPATATAATAAAAAAIAASAAASAAASVDGEAAADGEATKGKETKGEATKGEAAAAPAGGGKAAAEAAEGETTATSAQALDSEAAAAGEAGGGREVLSSAATAESSAVRTSLHGRSKAGPAGSAPGWHPPLPLLGDMPGRRARAASASTSLARIIASTFAAFLGLSNLMSHFLSPSPHPKDPAPWSRVKTAPADRRVFDRTNDVSVKSVPQGGGGGGGGGEKGEWGGWDGLRREQPERELTWNPSELDDCWFEDSHSADHEVVAGTARAFHEVQDAIHHIPPAPGGGPHLLTVHVRLDKLPLHLLMRHGMRHRRRRRGQCQGLCWCRRCRWHT